MRKSLFFVLIAVMLTMVVSASQAATLEEIKARGVLRVGCDFVEPMAYESGGQPVGLEVDLASAIAQALGVKLEFLRLDWDVITQAWKPGYDWADFDLAMASITITEEREFACLFSEWYFMTGQMVLVRTDSPINSPAQLNDASIATMGGTSCEKVARDCSAKVVTFAHMEDGYEMLRSGKADALIYDGATLMYTAKKDPAFRILDQKFTRERYGIAMPKSSEKLAEAVNPVVLKQRKALFDKWFK